MDETIRAQRHRKVLNPEVGSSLSRKNLKVKKSHVQAVKTDGGVFAQHGSKNSLVELERAEKVVHWKQYVVDRSSVSPNVIDL